MHRSPAAVVLFAFALGGCGSSGGPQASSGAASAAVDAASACSAALAAAPPGPAAVSARARTEKAGLVANDVRPARDLLALDRLAASQTLSRRSTAPPATRSGQLALVADDGTLVLAANPLDVAGSGFRFEPNAAGGYDVRRGDASFRGPLGQRVPLGDDDTRPESLPFTFSFYGAARGSAFVNSDGNLTFGAADAGSEDRSLGRLLAGPPRVAAFFADLDPSAGGGVFVNAAADGFTVTWCGVPDFDATGKVTAQASLLPGGAVELRIDGSTTLKDAMVALSPGGTSAFTPVDLSTLTVTGGGSAALGERFAAHATLDLVAAARRFYASFGDDYDQLVFWSDAPVTGSGTFAFESTIRNAITGIGQENVDTGAEYGSPARLASVLLMDDLGKYPADPEQPVNGESTTLAVVAHETGHRWGATLRFRDASGTSSDAWLGRQRAHWSFFTDSDASVLEGNAIEDRGGGSFRTVEAVHRFGPFDLYAMGLLEPSAVAPTFYVENPAGAGENRESPPRTGVAFAGTRREVRIADVVAAMGPRNPPAASAPRVHRQAWVYVVSRGRSADADALAKLDRFRSALERFFSAATGGRMSLETRLE
jgi:hypothetical protein